MLGVLFAFFIQYYFGIIKPKIPGGQLWIYKHEEKPDSLLYIFAGSFREHNWNLINKLMLEAAQRGEPDFKFFDPNSYVIRDYPK